MRIIHTIVFSIFVGLFVVGYTDNCFAEITKDTVTQINDQFKAKSSIYGTVLEKYAKKIFYWCLILEIVLLGAKAALNRAELADIISQFIMTLLFSGFCFAVITHYQEWTGQIINGLSNYANEASGTNLTLSPIYIGFDLMSKIIEEVSWLEPVKSLGFIIVGGVIMICFALIAARILVVKCESYIAMSAAVLLLGFGGTSLLKEYAVNTMRYALSVAFKLFVMQLVMGVGLSFINDFNVVSSKWEDLFMLIGCGVVLLVLVGTIPEIVAGIINGSHVGAGVGMRAAVTGAMAAAGGALGAVVGSVVAPSRTLGTVSDAVKIASLEGHSGTGKLGAALGNLWQGHQAARQSKNAMGSTGQRISSHMKDRKAAAKAVTDSQD